MPITGSQKALMQARSGLARSGATRSGYYTARVVINVGGAERTAFIIIASLELTLADGDEPSTARFIVKPSAFPAGFVPTIDQDVIIGLGTVGNREFAGKVSNVAHQRRLTVDQTPFVHVTCVDWLPLLDRRFVTKTYVGMSATEIGKDLIDTYTTGFTRLNIAPSLAVIDEFPLTYETVSGAFRRLAHMIGGRFYVDAFRDVHLCGPSGEPIAPTSPQPLTNTTGTLLSLQHRFDTSQSRTRIIVEMQRTQVPILGIPAGAFGIPVDDDVPFDPSTTPADGGGFIYTRLARIGTQRFSYLNISELGTLPTGQNAPGTTVTTAAAIGATQIEVADTTFTVDDQGWIQVGEQVVYFNDTDTGPIRLIDIPASGYGSIQAPIAVGTELRLLHHLGGVGLSPLDHSPGALPILVAQPPGEEVVSMLQVDNTAAQAALAASEGGDGIHEYVISDGRLTIDGAVQAALAELSAFNGPIVSAEWETEDVNAKPGRTQVIATTTPDAISTTLTINRVEVTFDETTPLRIHRRCAASTRKLADVEDLAALR